MDDKKYAVLIDADNISANYIKTIIDEITNEGVVTYKRIYGDWTSPNMKSWKDVLLEYSVAPIQQYGYTKGKNATDSAMIIDAMDILYTGSVDGFCLVSSDSDFTRLAVRLREAGMSVIGMGKQLTPRPFVTACNQFKYLDILAPGGNAEKPEPVKKQGGSSKIGKTEDSSQTPIEELKSSVHKLIAENSGDGGWMLISRLGSQLQKKYSDFDCRNYGYAKMAQLLDGLGFETKSFLDPNNKENPNCSLVYVKIK